MPREVLRRMGSLGFFEIRYPAEYGGSEMDALATVVLAEELGGSTFSGVAVTALVHSDMASIHVFRSGSQAQKDKWMPGIIAGEVITAVAVTEPDAGSDVKGIRTFVLRWRRLRPQWRQDVYHQRRTRQPLEGLVVTRYGHALPTRECRGRGRPSGPGRGRSAGL